MSLYSYKMQDIAQNKLYRINVEKLPKCLLLRQLYHFTSSPWRHVEVTSFDLETLRSEQLRRSDVIRSM